MMLDTLTLDIADISTRLNLPDADIADEALERYSPFITLDDAAPRFKINIALNDAATDISGFENETVAIRKNGSSIEIERDDISAEINQASGLGAALIYPSVYTLDSFLRILYSTQLPRRDGLLLHSSGVVRDNLAYIFIGPSESGKTTAASFSPPGGLLSDELTAVRIDGDAPVAHGTPFMGELNTGSVNISAPVAGLYFLNRSAPAGLRKIDAPRAISLLLACALNFDNDPKAITALLDIACKLCASARLRELSYDKNQNLWDIILNDNI